MHANASLVEQLKTSPPRLRVTTFFDDDFEDDNDDDDDDDYDVFFSPTRE